jgi:hypothetical protein
VGVRQVFKGKLRQKGNLEEEEIVGKCILYHLGKKKKHRQCSCRLSTIEGAEVLSFWRI